MGNTRFWNNRHQVCPRPKYSKVIGSNKTKAQKQDNHNQLMSYMYEGGNDGRFVLDQHDLAGF